MKKVIYLGECDPIKSPLTDIRAKVYVQISDEDPRGLIFVGKAVVGETAGGRTEDLIRGQMQRTIRENFTGNTVVTELLYLWDNFHLKPATDEAIDRILDLDDGFTLAEAS